MCGRYITVSKIKEIEKRFNVSIDNPEDYKENTNVSPGQSAPVISSCAPNKISFYRFGFTPSWSKTPTLIINARTEGDHNMENNPHYTGSKGIINKPMFRKALRSQRCLIVADAFYEGSAKEKLSKPFLIYMRNRMRPFAFAGIWDHWINPQNQQTVFSFAIITTVANPLLQLIGHPRMPVILPKEYEHDWLNDKLPLSAVTSLLEPFPAEYMNAYPVSPAMKKPNANNFDFLKPIGERVFSEHTYELYQELVLEGMGNTPARFRANFGTAQTDLFN